MVQIPDGLDGIPEQVPDAGGERFAATLFPEHQNPDWCSPVPLMAVVHGRRGCIAMP